MSHNPSSGKMSPTPRHTKNGFDSVLLIAFGGPEKPDEIRPFLERVTEGRQIPLSRLDEVVHHYEIVGGRSPLNEITRRQAEALQRTLARDGVAVPVYIGMRNWHPFLGEALTKLRADGCRRVLGVILSTFQTEASWGRYISSVEAARTTAGVPVVEYASGWSEQPLFIRAVADQVATVIGGMPPNLRDAPLLFTAHSIPRAMADHSPYVAQFRDASQRVAESLGRSKWALAYQSRSGNPSDAWLEPDVCECIEGFAKDGEQRVIVVPIGFVCDHVEVLYDLDVEARQRAESFGMEFYRVPTLNDHPLFIKLLASLVF